MKRSHVIYGAFTVIILGLSIWFKPVAIVPKDFESTRILEFFTLLFLISLILERALEVFVTAWRSPHATDLDLEISFLEEKISTLEPADPEKERHVEEKKEKKREKKKYRMGTQRLAGRPASGGATRVMPGRSKFH